MARATPIFESFTMIYYSMPHQYSGDFTIECHTNYFRASAGPDMSLEKICFGLLLKAKARKEKKILPTSSF